MGETDDKNLAQLPAAYAKWRGSTVGRITDALERRLVLDLIGDVSGCSVLDAGCGDGELAVELWRRGAAVAGVDASSTMIAAARRRAETHRAGIDFRIGNIEALPFPSESFDRVVAVTVLCFVEDGGQTLRELARVLKPGGRLVIGELNRWSTWAAARRIRSWLGSPLWRRARFRSRRELRTLAAEAGLVVTSMRGAVYYPRCSLAARALSRFDPKLGALTTIGAAFLALAATKPAE